MKLRWLLPMLCLFFSISSAWAQKRVVHKSVARPIRFIKVLGNEALKVTNETKSFPTTDFDGHDSEVLFNNLKYYLSQKAAAGKSDSELYQYLKGKPLLGNLTIDDWFVFYKSEDESVSRFSKDNEDLFFYGKLFRLRNKSEFPEPEREYIKSCAIGGYAASLPPGRKISGVSSKNELIKIVSDPVGDFWQNHILHLKTIVPATRRRDYKGYSTDEPCHKEFYVPSLQTHYNLAFAKEQPFQTVKVSEYSYFSFPAYEEITVEGEGLAAWMLENEPDVIKSYRTAFIVKLTPPFISSETVLKEDKIERRAHRAVQNRIYADIIGIWFPNYRTGEFNKKYSGENSKQ